MARGSFGPMGFLWRWLVAFVLVALSFNPSGVSYYHWVVGDEPASMPVMLLCGLLLLVMVGIYLRATWTSIGMIGIVASLAILGTLVWLFVDVGWLSLASGNVVGWIAIVILSFIMGIGMSWSHVQRKVSGQLDTDDIGD